MVRQRKSRGQARTKAKARYRKNKTRNKLKARVWRQRNKARVKLTRRRYKQNPGAHRRIAADIAQEIVFSFGPQETPGIVVGITPYGLVLFELDTDEADEDGSYSGDDGTLDEDADAPDPSVSSLPFDAFIDVATFDSDEDSTLFFMWADKVFDWSGDAGPA